MALSVSNKRAIRRTRTYEPDAVDLSYPLVVDTLGKMRALGMSLSVSCYTYLCHKHTWLDMDGLIARLGEDHPGMHDDLLPHFFCSKCRSAGRIKSGAGDRLSTAGEKCGKVIQPVGHTPCNLLFCNGVDLPSVGHLNPGSLRLSAFFPVFSTAPFPFWEPMCSTGYRDIVSHVRTMHGTC